MGTGLGVSASLRFALFRVDSADPRRRRLAGIVQGAVTGLASRLVGVAVSLLSVPLTIAYLGPERYGVWTLVGSLLAWVRLADLGIGNGLTNAIAGARGADRPDLVRAHVSTALAVLAAIALALGLIAAMAWPWIDWNGMLGVRTEAGRAEAGPAMAASGVIFLLGFPLSVVGRTFNATQEGRLGNYWSAAGNVAGLLALIAVTRTQGGLVWLVMACSGTGLGVQAASGVWLFARHNRAIAPRLRSVRRELVRGLLQVGLQFFLIQIMALVVFETDNLVIAHFRGRPRCRPTASPTACSVSPR